MEILLAEDAQKLSRQIAKGLTQEGHRVEAVFNGEDAAEYALHGQYDLLVLDVLLPGVDGFEVIRRLRKAENGIPVLMLTALDSMGDMVRGLDAGADDYLTKPFSFEVLCARIRSITRRGPVTRPVELRVSDLVLNEASKEVTRGGRTIELTRTEFGLLETLMSRAGSVVPREELQRLWSGTEQIKTNALDVMICGIRKKLTRPGEQELLLTSRGFGYYMMKRTRRHE